MSVWIPGPTSLAELIRAGDPDAIAGFRDAHAETVRGYCAKVCVADRVGEACHASFLDFLGRARTSEDVVPLAGLLLQATRSASAGRFEVRPAPQHLRWRVGDETTCLAMPELLAAEANGELRGDPNQVRDHVENCSTCTETAARMQEAERAFSHWLWTRCRRVDYCVLKYGASAKTLASGRSW